MSELIQIMRWHPRSPLAVYADTDQPSREPAGKVLDFTVSYVNPWTLRLDGPGEATEDERALAREVAAQRWPGMVVVP